ncbi:NrsF family protein [Novosphingobium sp.]|uniref:NrsF family protein n=1 Tax=Novosphingobium sp. TaxID=1874826 RepID=UPI0025FB2CB9|nr:NrsF family protein [Novosphingobium sp.]
MSDHPDTLIAALVDDLRPAAPLYQSRGMAYAVLALLAGAALVTGILGMRPDFAAGRPAALPVIAAGIFLVLALSSASAAIAMARPAVGARRDGWGWTALMAAVLPAGALFLAVQDGMSGLVQAFAPAGLYCLALGSAASVLSAAALIIWLRRGAPSSPPRAGLLVGVAAGSAGVFATSLWCQHDGLPHIGIWHGLTVIVGGIAGRTLLPRLLAW